MVGKQSKKTSQLGQRAAKKKASGKRPKKVFDFVELGRKIMQSIDVVEVARAAGLKLTGRKSGKGLQCYSIERPDSPKGVLFPDGRYYDNKSNQSLSFFDLIAALEGHANWKMVRNRLADELEFDRPRNQGTSRPSDNERTKASRKEKPKSRSESRTKAEQPSADCHVVYAALLNLLPSFAGGHKQRFCIDRKITRKQAEAIGERRYRPLFQAKDERIAITKELIASGLDVSGVPGFFKADEGNWTFIATKGYVFPSRGIDGKIRRLIVRRTNKDQINKYGKYRPFSSSHVKGPASPSSVHFPDLGEIEWGEVTDARLTEGELKADIATLRSKVPTIGLPGLNVKLAVAAIKSLPQLKRVRLALDADYRWNRDVHNGLIRIAEELLKLDLEVLVETWDPELGKGIDDYLGAYDEFRVDPEFIAAKEFMAEANQLRMPPPAADPEVAYASVAKHYSVDAELLKQFGRPTQTRDAGVAFEFGFPDSKQPEGMVVHETTGKQWLIPSSLPSLFVASKTDFDADQVGSLLFQTSSPFDPLTNCVVVVRADICQLATLMRHGTGGFQENQ